MPYYIVKTTCKRDEKHDYKLTLHYEFYPTWWDKLLKRLFGKIIAFKQNEPYSISFIGHSTVWHRLPGFYRPGTRMEFRLSNYFEKHQYTEKEVLTPDSM